MSDYIQDAILGTLADIGYNRSSMDDDEWLEYLEGLRTALSKMIEEGSRGDSGE